MTVPLLPRRFQRTDPATGAMVSEAPAMSPAEAATIADAAGAAFGAWAATGPAARRALLDAAATLLERRADAFRACMQAEMGASRAYGTRLVSMSAATLRQAAALTTEVTGEVIPSDKPGALSFTIRQPAGVVLGIAPWNAPLMMAIRAIAVPLACGNTVVLKASEVTPGTHRMVADLFTDAGFPPGVVGLVTNAPEDAAAVVEALVAHPAVRRVNFTGSTKVGRIIGALAARHLKPALLELGGKASVVVLADADLEAAVSAAVFGAFANGGQICMSTERIVVHHSIADAFVDRLAARAAAVPVGDTADPAVHVGPLVECAAVDRVMGLIEDAVAKGAVLRCGGRTGAAVMAPAVVDHVTRAMALYHEETFAPIAAVVRVADVDEAVRVANDTEYGLSAAVFGRDIGRTLGVARRLQTGICHINGATVQSEPQMPFGGVKASGYGRFGGRREIDEFTDLRWISITTGADHFPF